MELRNIVLIDLIMAVIILTGMGCEGCWIQYVKKCSANIVLTGHEKMDWHFLQILLAYWQKTPYFCSPFRSLRRESWQSITRNKDKTRKRIGSSAG